MTVLAPGRLPPGFAARLRPDLLRNTGELLVGGSPLRVVRLSARARSHVVGDRVVVTDSTSAQLAARLLDGDLADPEPSGVDVGVAELTVVVPVRDRAEQLDTCLAALAPLSVVVVDDASTDRASVAAVSAGRGATVLRLDHNLGPAGARNAGLAGVRTGYVAFVDSDVEVTADQLLGLTRHFADEHVALVGPRIHSRSRSARPRWFERYDAAASSLDLGGTGARVAPGSRVAWLPSACLVGRVSALREHHGFDSRMRVGEDVDLVWRLVAAGAVVRYAPEHRAHHDTRSTMRGWLGRTFFYGTGGAALAARHGDRTAPAVLSPTMAVGAAAVLLRSRWSLPVAVLAAARTAHGLRGTVPGATRRGVPLEVDVAIRSLGWAVRQESALLLRHWWPAATVGSLLSRRVRTMVGTALVADAVTTLARRPDLGLPEVLVGRRLDDLAYGAGLWFGAIRSRSARCLLPRRARASRGRATPRTVGT